MPFKIITLLYLRGVMLSDHRHSPLGEAIAMHGFIAERLDPASPLKMSEHSGERAWFQPEIMRSLKFVPQFSPELGTFFQTEEYEVSRGGEPFKV